MLVKHLKLENPGNTIMINFKTKTNIIKQTFVNICFETFYFFSIYYMACMVTNQTTIKEFLILLTLEPCQDI